MYAAIECREFGPIDDLAMVERESPPLQPRQVRLAVSAAGVNFVDGLLVEGRYQIKPPLPYVPGMEVVGRIVEVGDAVEAPVSIGDRVFANLGFGGYATEAVAWEHQIVALPDSLTDGQAATFMQSYLTGWYALRVRGGVAAGDTLLVLGAGSGVGLAAVDLGAALGLRVIAAASSEEKRALAMSKGALATIDTTALDAGGVKDAAKAFAATFEDRAERGGVDHLYDPVGGELGEVALRALGEDGQYLVIGFVAGIPRLAANQVLLRNRRITGVDWGAWAGRHPAENQAMLAEVIDLIGQGAVDPVEPTTYPLGDAALALRDLANRQVAGTVALTPPA
ncbi:MAG: NADPH:quinone oxidoreductase family protein [Ilumatobacteraceae bacterium]